jgi:hypothetical protein
MLEYLLNIGAAKESLGLLLSEVATLQLSTHCFVSRGYLRSVMTTWIRCRAVKALGLILSSD